jgi:TusA-related sulfurtransferase
VTIDLEDLGLDRGAHLLIDRALSAIPVGGRLTVRGRDPALGMHLRAWARGRGHTVLASEAAEQEPGVLVLVRGGADHARWLGAERAGGPAPGDAVGRPGATWGLAARGALIEQGGPAVHFDFEDKHLVWADLAPRLYAQAAANQWDPATAIDWHTPFDLPSDIEAAVVQVMTYLVENEQVALIVPARFLGRIHPHFREVLQVLAVQAADEARHIEVFARRAALRGGPLGVSGAGGRASLATLLEEPDFALASFLLSVLGEGSFLNLLAFLEMHAPDPIARRVTHLARQDESRHVAFGMAHLEHQAVLDPALRDRLRAAVERRHDALIDSVGLNQQVFDALAVLAAGAWTPAAIAHGYAAVARLQADMDEGRQRRLAHLGFPPDEAAALSALHTRNFM